MLRRLRSWPPKRSISACTSPHGTSRARVMKTGSLPFEACGTVETDRMHSLLHFEADCRLKGQTRKLLRMCPPRADLIGIENVKPLPLAIRISNLIRQLRVVEVADAVPAFEETQVTPNCSHCVSTIGLQASLLHLLSSSLIIQ